MTEKEFFLRLQEQANLIKQERTVYSYPEDEPDNNSLFRVAKVIVFVMAIVFSLLIFWSAI